MFTVCAQIRDSKDCRAQRSDPIVAAAPTPARLSGLQELLFRAPGERQFTGIKRLSRENRLADYTVS